MASSERDGGAAVLTQPASTLPVSSGESLASSTPATSTTTSTAAKNDKDRPRRRKARRACFACQRAHLTCGDERPCQRCIKRGLQNQCHDGVRKKAKYLHDAPGDDPSADRNHPNAMQFRPQHQSQMSGNYGSMPPPPEGTINPTSIAEQSPISPLTTQSSPITALQTTTAGNGFGMDSEAAWFNFDMAGLGDFGSRFGAMEFGALGQFQGANSVVSNPGYDATFSPNGTAFPLGYSAGDEINSKWAGTGPNSRNNSTPGPGMGGLNFPNTYTIAAAPSSLTSPSPPAPSPQALGGSNAASPGYHDLSATSPNLLPTSGVTTGGFYRPPQSTGVGSFSGNYPMLTNVNQNQLQQRRPKPPQDPSTIYQTVSKPYPYPEHFHRLFHLIETRFPRQSVVRIARSFALFRPSFIACTQTLKEADLVFMEKCFQRTLWEYEKFIQSCGTPTIVCRRTGEIAAVGKEFCMLTGWTKEVLLGEKTNLNTNFIGAGKPLNPVAPARSAEFPKDVEEDMKPATPKPVFLAELLDEESVVQFYEEFAKMAFGDSRGSVTTRCKVLKYVAPITYDEKGNEIKTNNRSIGLGPGKDGKVECTFCWTIKRDVFDIPMLIVGNFLPILEGPTTN